MLLATSAAFSRNQLDSQASCPFYNILRVGILRNHKDKHSMGKNQAGNFYCQTCQISAPSTEVSAVTCLASSSLLKEDAGETAFWLGSSCLHSALDTATKAAQKKKPPIQSISLISGLAAVIFLPEPMTGLSWFGPPRIGPCGWGVPN